MTAAARPTGDTTPVVLVDREDHAIGLATKADVHRTGTLHRAVSVFAFGTDGRLLLQRRAAGKHHSGGLWSNSACTHPLPDEATVDAASRCLRDEVGVEATRMRLAGAFIYRQPVGGGLVEHEFDHVFRAVVTGDPRPDPREVEACRWVALAEVEAELRDAPDRFTAWFALALRVATASADATPPGD
jgi:isopentenyl-diphosphate Delta-isomerase